MFVDLISILAQKISQVRKQNQNPDTHWLQDQSLSHLRLENLFYTLFKTNGTNIHNDPPTLAKHPLCIQNSTFTQEEWI